MSTVVECIRSVFPNSPIETVRNENYPIRVIISSCTMSKKPVAAAAAAEEEEEEEEEETNNNNNNRNKQQQQQRPIIWSGKQQNLFLKYKSKRKKTIKSIVENLKDYRDELKSPQPACVM